MKKIAFIIFGLILSANVFAQSAEEAEKEIIKGVVQRGYVEGLQNEGDLEKIEECFHPDFRLIGIGENESLWTLPIEEWKTKQVKRREEGKLPRPMDKQVSVEFLSVDLSGTAAVVKLEFLVGGEKKYIDYISLYKFESGWKMVNKIYYKLPE